MASSAQESLSINTNLPFILTKEFEYAATGWPIDLEGDGKDEFLFLVKTSDMPNSLRCYRDALSIPLWQINFPTGKILESPLAFQNEEGELVILVSVTEDTIAYLHVYDSRGKQLGRYEIAKGIDRNGDGKWDGRVRPQAVADLNGDGMRDVLVVISTAYDLYPRGICAFDLKNGKKLWEFQTGAFISDVAVADLTQNGSPEVILGSAAMDNGSSANDTDDSHSYLIVLDSNGEILRLREMGGIFSRCIVHTLDLSGDDNPELASILRWQGKDSDEMGRLTVWNGAAQTKKWEITGDFLNVKMASADINKDGKEELIIAGGLKPRLLIFGDDPEPIAQKSIGFQPEYFLLVDDLNIDGSVEIVVSGRDRTVVFDDELRPIAQTSFTGKPQVVKQGFGVPKKLALASKDHFVLFSMKRNVAYYNVRMGWLVLGIVIGAFAVIIIVFGISRSTSRNRYLRSFKLMLEKLPCTSILFDTKGKILIITNKANEFLDRQNGPLRGKHYSTVFVKELQESVNSLFSLLQQSTSISDVSKSTEHTLANGRQIQISAHTISQNRGALGGILVCIQDISLQSESKRALEWAAMAQRLAHEIKNPLSVVKLTLQRLHMAFAEHNPEHGDVYRQHVDSIMEEVERLRGATDGFMKLARAEPPHFKAYPIGDVVNAIKDRFTEKLPEGIKFEIEVEENLPVLEIDLEQILMLFSNLIDNSVRAMEGKGLLQLSVSLFQKIDANSAGTAADRIVFELSDTGCGIPKDRLERVFEPFFSEETQGTGLGLAISKRIVEDHDGDISIVSKVGAGTTVRIELPVTA